MATSCVLVMSITDRNGDEIESKLNRDLLSVTTYERATQIYNGLVDPDKVDGYREILPIDENGEFLIGPVKVLMDLLSWESYKDELEHQKGRYLPNGQVKNYTMEAAREEVKKFNNPNNPLSMIYHMQSNKTPNGKRHIEILLGKNDPYATVLYSLQNLEKELDANIELNKKLRVLGKQYGISDGFLSEIEERMGINGVMDTLTAKKTVDGLLEVVRLARDERGEKAVPEEFAHAFIELLGLNHPVVSRLINLLGLEGMVEEVLGTAYDAYEAKYEGDRLLLAKEALGLLVAKHWLKNEPIPTAPYKSLLTRFFDAIKQFFNGKKGLELDLLKSLELVNQEVGSFAKDLLANRMADKIDMKNLLKNQTKLFSLEERVEALKRILTQVVENKTKLVRIAEKRAVHGLVDELLKNYIDELSDNIEDAKFVEGLYTFIKNAIEELKSHQAVYVKMGDGSSGATTTNQMAAMLRTIKNFTASYGSSVKELKKEIARDEIEKDKLYPAEFKKDLNVLSELCDHLEVQYEDLSYSLVEDFFTQFVGDSLVMKMGPRKGETITLKELMDHSSQDIGFFDRWMDSMADSSDLMLRLFNHSVDSFKLNSARRTLDYIKELLAMLKTLEESGVKSTDFMYDRDENGKITGKPVAELDYTAFEMAKDAYKKSLDVKYGLNPTQELWNARLKDMYEWYLANTETVNEVSTPNKNIYASDKYNKLSKAEKEYYDMWMRIKKELDSFTPQGSKNNYNMPQIRKDLIERVKGAKSAKGALDTIKESAKDLVLKREKDIEFGGELILDKTNLLDFEGNKVMTLPIYFVGKLDNMDDLSTDATSSLAAYASMAVEFNEMSQAVHLLELTRDVMKKRVVDMTENGKPIMLTVLGFGRTFSNKMTKETNATNMIAKLNDYMDMLIYGRFKNDEGTFGNSKIDKAKMADFVNRMTSLNNLALNALAGTSNLGTGNVMMMIEAVAGLYYNVKDIAKAHKTYVLLLPGFLGNIGNRIKTDKLSLIFEYFNISLDAEGRGMGLQMDLKGLARFMNTSTLFFLTRAGEHLMAGVSGLAMLSKVKMKDSSGKEVDLINAFEEVPVKGNDLKYGAKLLIKKGYTKMDGSEFTAKDRDEIYNRIKYVNQTLLGIYNKQDMNMSLKHAIMRLVYMFRKWMPAAWNRRAGKAQYNYLAGDWTEGYYRSFFSFMAHFAKDLKGFKFALMSENWSQLSKLEKGNIKKALTEIGAFASLTLAVGMIEWPDDDWFSLFAEYELRRLLTEIGAMTPTWLLPKLLFTIVKSPAAASDYVLRILDVFNIANYGEKIQSGRYKGMYKGEKFWLETVPMNRTLYKVFNPDQALVFLKVQ